MLIISGLAYRSRKLNRIIEFSYAHITQFRVPNESFQNSRLRPVGDPESYTDYEVRHNPEQWKYVERLLPVKWIPEPTVKENYPSGWKPQSAIRDKFPYFVERTKNHMLPVYLEITHRGTRRITVITKVEGDIWKLSHELVEYLKPLMDYSTVGVRVEELRRAIFFRGDYVEYILQFLKNKGF